MSKIDVKALLELFRPPLDFALDHPEDYFLYHPQLACKIGLKNSMIVCTIAMLSLKKSVTNHIAFEIFEGCLGCKATLTKRFKKLEDKGLLEAVYLTKDEVVNLLKNKKMQGYGFGGKVCSWCGCQSYAVHAHHYPIAKKDGGKQTIEICLNCHREYHYLVGQGGRPELFHYQVNTQKAMELMESTVATSGELTPGSEVGRRKALSKRGERINGHLRLIK